MIMSYLVANPRLTAGPSGELISPADLAGYLGSLSATPSDPLLARIANTASQIIENILGYSFRQRTFQATIPNGNCLIYLPWGPARDFVTDPEGLVVTEQLSDFQHITLVRVESSERFELSWTVGSESNFPDEAAVATLRVASALWDKRVPEPDKAFKADILSIAGNYKVQSDWLC